jgi:hypothetical protein
MSQQYGCLTPPLHPSQLVLSSLFSDLTDGIEAARDLVYTQIDQLPPDSYAAEEAYQHLTRLIFLHTSRHPSPAALSRDVLEQAIVAFPNNTSFLSLYLWGEMGAKVYGRVQRLVAQLSRSDGVVGHLWAVWAEGVGSSRTFWDGGADRVRMALDKAINSSTYVMQ